MKLNESAVTWISLFTSVSTLLCCALPVLFVFLGLGTALVTLSTHFSWLIQASEYKFWLFLVSGIFLIIGSVILRFPMKTCPIDPKLKAKCLRFREINRWVLLVSKGIWVFGFVMAYLALPLRLWLGG